MTRKGWLHFWCGCAGLVIGMLALTQHVYVQSPIVLEDFSTLRMGFDTPPGPLWSPYADQYSPSQTGGITGGMYQLNVPSGNVPDFQFMTYPYDRPSGFAKYWIRSGTWDPNVNRLEFWVKSTASVQRNTDGSPNLEIGTYTKAIDNQPANQGDHYYHQIDFNIYPNRWVKFVLNRVPQHQVSDSGTINYPDNPTAPGWNYYDGLTRFYFGYAYQSSSVWGNATYWFKDYRFSIVSGEPDTQVATVTAQYTGTRYELTWAGPKSQVVSYDVRYSTSSMKGTGFLSGTSGGTVKNTGDTYTGVFWSSPAMAEAAQIYLAIRPQGGSAFTEISLPAQGGGGTPTAPGAPANLRISGS
jgi:hypothetical protein